MGGNLRGERSFYRPALASALISSLVFFITAYSSQIFATSTAAKPSSRFEFSQTFYDTPADLLGPSDFEARSLFHTKKRDAVTGFSVNQYTIYTTLEPKSMTFSAAVDISVTRTQSETKVAPLDMDSELKVLSVSIDDKPAKYQHTKNQLLVTIPKESLQTFKVSVRYKGKGQSRGLVFVKKGKAVVQAWTVAEPEDARKWLPSFDQPDLKAPVTQFVTVPENWKVLSNGELKSIRNPTDNQVTYEWVEKYPLATYLISILAGELNVIEAASTPVPVSYWVPYEDIDAAKKGFDLTPEMISFYSKTLVPYPYEKYAIGIAYNFGGAMEHTTSTTFSHGIQTPKGGMDSSVAAHELAHHWFGDLVTCQTWNDLWLNEGFASYFDVVFWEAKYGEQHRTERLEKYRRRYLGEEIVRGMRLGPIYNPSSSPEEKFSVVNYEKAALVIHLLRSVLGDENFFRGLNHFLVKHKFRSATTQDFQDAMEEKLNVDLTTFFKQWIYQAGFPKIEFEWRYLESRREVQVFIRQTQPDQFDFPADIYIDYLSKDIEAKSMHRRVLVNSKEFMTSFPVPSKPQSVLFDPYHIVITTTKSAKTSQEWQYVLKSTPYFLARAEAISELKGELSFEELRGFIDSNDSPLVKGAAISSLAYHIDSDRAAVTTLAKGLLKSNDDDLRAETIKLFDKLKDLSAVGDLIHIVKYDLNWRVSMQATQVLGEMKAKDAVEPLIDEITREPRRGYMLSAVLMALGKIGDRRATVHILRAFESTQEYRMKAAIVASLGTLRDPDSVPAIGKSLIQEPDESFAIKLVTALKDIGDKSAIKYLRVIADNPEKGSDLRSAAATAIDSF